MSNRTFQALLVLLAAVIVSGDLLLGNRKCGEKRCKRDEFCSLPDYFCQSCAIACDSSSHNYEEKVCEKECQSEYVILLLQMRAYYVTLTVASQNKHITFIVEFYSLQTKL